MRDTVNFVQAGVNLWESGRLQALIRSPLRSRAGDDQVFIGPLKLIQDVLVKVDLGGPQRVGPNI